MGKVKVNLNCSSVVFKLHKILPLGTNEILKAFSMSNELLMLTSWHFPWYNAPCLDPKVLSAKYQLVNIIKTMVM